MNNIAIIGVGQLGSRHLQGLAKIDIPIDIEVVDLSLDSLELAKERFEQMPLNQNIKSIAYKNSFEKLSNSQDLVIVATNSNIRYNIVKNLLAKKNVKNIVLEKVVFQNIQHFDEIISLLEKRKIKCWVNCTKRMFPFYKDLKTKLKNETSISISVQGGDWGLACNSVHYLDLLAFLSNSLALKISTEFLDKDSYPSKREGFVEVSGLLVGKIENNKISLYSGKQAGINILTIKSDSFLFVIDELNGEVKISSKDDNWKWKTKNEKIIYYQSELSHLFAKDILVNDNCDLPSLNESCFIHKPFLLELTAFINKINNTDINYCPIT